MARKEAADAIKAEAKAKFLPEGAADKMPYTPAQFSAAFEAFEERVVRDITLEGTRIDGRALNQLRAISCEVDVLPRTHGSAVFPARRDAGAG